VLLALKPITLRHLTFLEPFCYLLSRHSPAHPHVFYRGRLAAATKHTSKLSRAPPFAPQTARREAVAVKTAALDARMQGTEERVASMQRAVNVNREAFDKAVAGMEKCSIKTCVDAVKLELAVSSLTSELFALRTTLGSIKKLIVFIIVVWISASVFVVIGNVLARPF